MAARKNTPSARVKERPTLPDIADALSIISSTVDVAVAALGNDGYKTLSEQASMMLYRHVSIPLEEQRAKLDVYSASVARPRRKRVAQARRGRRRKRK